jgi:thiol:disulfide interchange protein
MRLTIRLLGWCVLAALVVVPSAFAEWDWNDGAIKWRPYADALNEAKHHHKPICLVIYTTWCPHCRNYASHVFHEPSVVKEAKQFVMVRLDADAQKGITDRFDVDGTYIPRTFFLTQDGAMKPGIHADRDNFKYFYSEVDPASLLAGMREARKLPPRVEVENNKE